jgi:GNAT superfamily N-acetyltransferase
MDRKGRSGSYADPTKHSLDGMATGAPKICVGEPASFAEAELDDFTAFVPGGGEVTAKGLRERVGKAAQIAFARENECLVGVAGLKKPDQSYRGRIERSAKAKLPAKTLPLELGWIFVLPSARGRKISGAFCRPLVAQAENSGIFATSRIDNMPMHCALERLGFNRVGREWPSKENNAKLALFIRNAV